MLSPFSALQWHRQPPPGVSQSLVCSPLHILKSSLALLTATLHLRLLQELLHGSQLPGELCGMQRGGRGGEGLSASLDPSQAVTAISMSRFFSWLLLLGVAALWLHLGTLSFMGKRGEGAAALVFEASSAVFNIPEEHKIHELFSEGHTFLHVPRLNTVPVLQIRAREQCYTRTRCDWDHAGASSRDHSLTAAWSAADRAGPQVFLLGGTFFHQFHSSLA